MEDKQKYPQAGACKKKPLCLWSYWCIWKKDCRFDLNKHIKTLKKQQLTLFYHSMRLCLRMDTSGEPSDGTCFSVKPYLPCIWSYLRQKKMRRWIKIVTYSLSWILLSRRKKGEEKINIVDCKIWYICKHIMVLPATSRYHKNFVETPEHRW